MRRYSTEYEITLSKPYLYSHDCGHKRDQTFQTSRPMQFGLVVTSFGAHTSVASICSSCNVVFDATFTTNRSPNPKVHRVTFTNTNLQPHETSPAGARWKFITIALRPIEEATVRSDMQNLQRLDLQNFSISTARSVPDPAHSRSWHSLDGLASLWRNYRERVEAVP